MIVDQPIDTDQRVLACIEAYKRLGWDVDILSSYKPLTSDMVKCYVHAHTLKHLLFLCLAWPWEALVIASRFARFCKSRNVARYRLRHLWLHKGFWRETLYYAYKGFVYACTNPGTFSPYSHIHAHDLKSLSFAHAIGKTAPHLRLIYDAHELGAFRNRKNNSLLCALLTTAYERMLSSEATLIISVSSPCLGYIKLFSRKNKPVSYRLVCNNFYEDTRPVTFSKISPRRAILYIGSLIAGRGIDQLLKLSERVADLDVILYCPEDTHKQQQNAKRYSARSNVTFHFGSYDADFQQRAKQYASVIGWLTPRDCCLSYRFSVSNKLFQYIQYGLPILYQDGLHSSDLLKSHTNSIQLDEFVKGAGAAPLGEHMDTPDNNTRIQKLKKSNYAKALSEFILQTESP
ncbi:hypothetical protein [uncultured Cohaesibacter sp.]|uniref:hypothetical protein n=1 Tax=uncultured Cohaesibacter sp. TaxID=1002546 RepID=UPI0029C797E2|nr:hypothetical protein [uncultured Cohaesibacter sp.]